MIDYTYEINTAVQNGLFDENDIYNFKETPYEVLLNQYYTFCRENLNTNGNLLNISPNIFIFLNNYSRNAKAAYSPSNHYVIVINSGLFIWCIENLLNNVNLNQYLQNKFAALAHYDSTMSALTFQIATQFTFYHELGHLIQFSKTNQENELQERSIAIETFSLEKHKLEINADSFACIAIASHIQQYLDNSFGQKLNQTLAQDSITVLAACLLRYLLSFADNMSCLYLRENTHPHAIVRLLSTLLNILNYLNQSPFLTARDIRIEILEVFKNVLDLYEELEVKNIFDTNLTELLDTEENTQQQLTSYVQELNNFDLINYHNALEQWNNLIVE